MTLAPPPSPSSLIGHDLSLGYLGTRVLHDVSVSLTPGRVSALVGPNGSGKSTLLRGLARLHQLDAGVVTLDGLNTNTLSGREFATRLAMLAQHRPTPAGITVTEAVSFGRHPHRSRLFGKDPQGRDAVTRALRLTHLTDLAEHPVDELSGGQVQRVWLAACLAQETGVLLLDEPTNHLDLRHQIDLLHLVRELADEHGVAIGLVLHDLEQAAAVSDEVTLLHQGRVLAHGSPAEVLTSAHLTHAYEVPIEARLDDAGHLRISALSSLSRPRLAPVA